MRPPQPTARTSRLKGTDSRGLRRLVFWHVPKPKTAKTRVHVDLASKDPAAMIKRLVALGATVVEKHPAWTVMADPEGNEFWLG